MSSRSIRMTIVFGVIAQFWTHCVASSAHWYQWCLTVRVWGFLLSSYSDLWPNQGHRGWGSTLESHVFIMVHHLLTHSTPINHFLSTVWESLIPFISYFEPVWGFVPSPQCGGVGSPGNSGGRPWHRHRLLVCTDCASRNCTKEGWHEFHPNSRDAQVHLCIDLLEWQRHWGEIS